MLAYKHALAQAAVVVSIFLLFGCPKSSMEDKDNTPAETGNGTTTTTDTSLCSSGNRTACLYQAQFDYGCHPGAPNTACSFWTDEIVDETRVGGPRTIPVAVYLPPAPTPPFPVVLLSHGGAGGKTNPVNSLPGWAEPIVNAGYLVVGIAHPPRDEAARAALCNELGIDDPLDCDNFKYLHYDRPYDIKKVLDWLENPDNPAYVYADRERIGLLGHSAGAGAGMMIAGASRTYADSPVTYADSRVSAFLAFSPQGPGNDGFDDRSWDAVRAPSLFGTGSGDSTGDEPDPANRRQPYEHAASAEKYLFYINDADARHGMYEMNLDACDAAAERCAEFGSWLQSVALAFLDAELRDRDEARQWLSSDNIVTASDGTAEWHRP